MFKLSLLIIVLFLAIKINAQTCLVTFGGDRLSQEYVTSVTNDWLKNNPDMIIISAGFGRSDDNYSSYTYSYIYYKCPDENNYIL